MPKLKINWRIAPQNESLIYDFDDIDLTQEEWDNLDDFHRQELCDHLLYDEEETVAYALVDGFEIINE